MSNKIPATAEEAKDQLQAALMLAATGVISLEALIMAFGWAVVRQIEQQEELVRMVNASSSQGLADR